MEPAGRAHRIEAVRAGHEDDAKTVCSGSTLPELRKQRLRRRSEAAERAHGEHRESKAGRQRAVVVLRAARLLSGVHAEARGVSVVGGHNICAGLSF